MSGTATVWVLVSGLWLAACAELLPVSMPPAVAACAVDGRAPSAQEAAAVLALQRSVEQGPLYSLPAAASGLAACTVRQASGGAITLAYEFRDGDWLRVQRDASIEFTEQVARFKLPPAQQPEVILARAERVAFGADGCGIDWRRAETQAAEDDPQATETVFRGETCNCQARIRRLAGGRVVGLTLRSAC